MENEFLILLQAKLDEAKSKGNVNADIKEIQNQIDKLKIQAEIDPKIFSDLIQRIEQILNQKIDISNIGIDSNKAVQSAQQTGKQIVNAVNQGVSQGLNGNDRVLDSFRRSLQNIGMGSEEINTVAERIRNLGIQIESLNQSTSHSVGRRGNRNIVSVDISGIDQYGQAIKLTQQYNVETGKLINTIDNVSTVQQKAGSNINTFAKQQSRAVSNLTNQINQLNRAAKDPNASRSISDQSHLKKIQDEYNNIISAIQRMGSASSSTFVDEQNNVKTLISEFKSLISEYRNAENVSTTLKPDKLASAISKAQSQFTSLNTDIQNAQVSSQKLTDNVNLITEIFDKLKNDSSLSKSEVEQVFTAISNARNELTSLIKIDASNSSVEKIRLQADTLKNKLDDFSKKNEGFATWSKNVNGVTVSVETLKAELDGVKTSSDLSVATARVNEFESAFKAANTTILNTEFLAKKICDIEFSIDNGHGASEYQNRINSIIATLERYGVEAKEAKNITASLQSTFDNMKGLSGQELVAQADKLEKEFKSVKISVDQAKLSYDKLMQPASKEKVTATLVKIQKLLSNNTKVTAEVKNEWQSYVNRLSSGSDIAVKEINDINIRLKQTESQMRSIGKFGLSWTDKLKQAWEKFGGWGFATGTMMTLYNQLRKMPKAVYEIDTAMTNLYKVTDETSSKYNQFLESANESAYNLGRSVSSLVEQTSNWAKLGFDIDTASNLAKTSSIYANVGEVDDDTAVSDLVTAMKAFNIEASDSITIVDKFNKLGNEFATSAKDLGDGLSRSASAMATAGTDINKTLAMLTGGTEITQNASEFGNFLKIGSMRIRGMKGALEELGEEVDETVDSISKVQTQILNRTNGKVNIFDDLGNFRDYYDIMEDISKIYNELSDTNKADLTEILFGKQRGNQGAALIQAFQSGQIQKALEATLNAQGSAMQEQEKWLESLEAKTQQLEAAFQSLSSTVLDSDLLKWFVDLGTNGTKALESITKFLTPLGTLLTGAGIFASFKNVGRPKMFGLICY